MGFWFGFDTGFDIMRVFVFAIFAIVIVCFIALAVKGIGTWHKNNNSPRLTVQAAVVAKRQNTDVHHHSNNNGGMHTSTSTQELLCRGWFLPPNTYDCGSFVVNGTAVVGKEPKKPYNRCKSTQKGAELYEISI